MGILKGTCIGGVRTPDDLRQRSHVDPESGCWHWKQSCWKSGAPAVTVVVDGKKIKVTGRRAALVVSGVSIPKGQTAYAKPCCHSDDCVIPAHAQYGTHQQFMASLSARGKFDDPSKVAHLLRANEAKRKLTPEQRMEAAVSDEPADVAARRLGVTTSLIYRIRSGGHTPARAASVFEWRG